DRAQVRLNHELHLKPGLRGPAGAGGVQLACGDCHQGPMALSGVRFAGTPSPVPSPGDAPDLIPAEEPSYMAPVRFVRHCAGCHQCHVRSCEPGAVLPTVAPTELPVRWLPQSRFDHGTHRLLGCTECHAAPASERTEDSLMPRRATCQRCHHAGGASDRCSECHTYHGVTGPVEVNGGRAIARLLGEP